MQLQPNITFDNHYTLIRQLGRGGFSEVWLAHDGYMDLDVALKIYAPGQGMDEHSIDELRREIKVVFTLNHPNLLTPKYLGVWNGMPYLVLAYCSRGSLTQQIGKLSEQELWHVLHDVAAGLAYLHKNDIVHQDIKPDNILLDESGNYVITDFGISTKARSTLRKSVIGGAVSGGTMAYMGPERFSKQPAPTKASDIWSLGAMMFELITGNVPFGEHGGVIQKSGAEIPEITENVASALKGIIEQMLALNTWDRPTADNLSGFVTSPQPIARVATPIPHKLAQEQSTSSRETQRFVAKNPAASPKSTPGKNNRNSTDHGTGGGKSWVWWLILACALIIGIPVGVSVYQQHQEIVTQEKEAINDHNDACSSFNSYLNRVKTSNIGDEDINNLRRAAASLKDLKISEANTYYKGNHIYTSKKTELLNKVTAMRTTLNKVKSDAWSTTDTSYKNAERRLNDINKILKDYSL